MAGPPHGERLARGPGARANNALNAGFLLKPRSWGWDDATALAAAVLVGGVFAILAARAGRVANGEG
jgi:hypothetical protein